MSLAFAGWLPVGSPALGLQTAAGRVNLLTELCDLWRTALPEVAHVRAGDPDPSRTLLDLLSTDAVSSSYQARPFVGPRVRDCLRLVAGMPSGGAPGWPTLEQLLTGWGLFASRIPLLGAGGFTPTGLEMSGAFVTDPKPGWEDQPVGWIRAMDRTTVGKLQDNWYGPDQPLLAKIFRHSLLQAYADAAFALVPVAADPPPLPEPELVDLADISSPDPVTPASTLTSLRHLTQAQYNGIPVADYIHGQTQQPKPAPQVAPVGETVAALHRLTTRPAAEIARLAASTLDAATYRLDAWVTAVATDRLRALRATRPDGVHIGGFGYVQNLQPATRRPSTGYVHAPSAAHAATAGVLRSGYLTHGGEALAVDLSSGRVRLALELLDAVREGQTLGAALGYRFERELHDTGLAQYQMAFRELAPEAVGVLSPTPIGTPATAVAALVTVDGLALLKLAAEDGVPWGTTPTGQAQQLPQAGTDHHTRLVSVLQQLRDGADAVADLGLAESVHQTLQRNHLRAGGSLDALSRGELPPPEPEVVRSPRTGVGISHRVLLVAPGPDDGAAATALADWTATDQQRALHARAAAEPRVNAWAALVLGDPGRVRWRATYLGENGARTGYIDEFTLAEVGLCPLDVLAATSPDVASLSETNLGARLLRHAVQLPAAEGRTGQPELILDRAAGWETDVLSVPQLLTIADAARSLVAAGREATAQDLAPTGVSTSTGIDEQELADRASTATSGLSDALTALRSSLALTAAQRTTLADLFPATFPTPSDAQAIGSLIDLPMTCDMEVAVTALNRPAATDLDTLRDQLDVLAGYGVPGSAATDVTGTGVASATRIAVQARASAVTAAERLTPAAAADGDLAALAAIFGAGFRALPLFDPSLPAGTAPLGANPAAVDEWFEDIARVREPSARLANLNLLADAAGAVATHWRVVQHPADSGRWVALALEPPASRPGPPQRMLGGRVSVALAGLGATPPTSQPQAMLAVDQWVEVVPNHEEDTALAFHCDVPDNCAPQAMLLAVHPDPDLRWDDATVVDVVKETAALADVRMVDPELVPVLGQLLPALLFAQNVGGDPAGDTISTTLRE